MVFIQFSSGRAEPVCLLVSVFLHIWRWLVLAAGWSCVLHQGCCRGLPLVRSSGTSRHCDTSHWPRAWWHAPIGREGGDTSHWSALDQGGDTAAAGGVEGTLFTLCIFECITVYPGPACRRGAFQQDQIHRSPRQLTRGLKVLIFH